MLFKNTLAQSAPLIFGYLYSILLAPLMLSQLGLRAFGVWAVTGALATYAGLLDLGITNSLARFVALYNAQGNRRGIQECVGLGLVTVTVLGTVGAAVAFLAAPALANGLHVFDAHDMRLILLSSVVIFVFNLYSKVLAMVPIGLRRMVPPNMAGVAANTLNFAGSVAILLATGRLVDYALVNAGVAIVGTGFSAASFAYVWRRPYVSPPSRHQVRTILPFSLKVQAVWIADIVNFEADKVIIALLVNPAAAGAYEIVARVVAAVRSLGVITTSAIIPSATADIVERGREVVVTYYRRYTPKSLALAYPLFAVACVTGPFLLVAWLGRIPSDAIPILVMLSASYAVNVTTGVPTTVLASDGRPGLNARTSTLAAVLNIALTVPLAAAFGLWGVLAGTFVATAAGNVVLLVRFHGIYGLRITELVTTAGRPAALALGLSAPFAVWYAVVQPHVDGRPLGFVGLAVMGVVYMTAYWLAAGRLDLLPERLAPQRLLRRAVRSAA